MRFAIVAMLLALPGCHRAPAQPADLVVDQCALEEYRQECEMTAGGELGTPEGLQACFAKARTEALRIWAGVPAQCRGS